MALPAMERAALVDELLATLDQPDPVIDALWIKECEDRIAAIERGEAASKRSRLRRVRAPTL